MLLLDHFQATLAGERYWESFHVDWATKIISMLNPLGYVSE
jgi:hypothetical protein